MNGRSNRNECDCMFICVYKGVEIELKVFDRVENRQDELGFNNNNNNLLHLNHVTFVTVLNVLYVQTPCPIWVLACNYSTNLGLDKWPTAIYLFIYLFMQVRGGNKMKMNIKIKIKSPPRLTCTVQLLLYSIVQFSC